MPQASQQSARGWTNSHLGHCMVPGEGPGGISTSASGPPAEGGEGLLSVVCCGTLVTPTRSSAAKEGGAAVWSLVTLAGAVGAVVSLCGDVSVPPCCCASPSCFASCSTSRWRFRYFRITTPHASQMSPVGCTNSHLGHCMVPGSGPGGTSKVGSASVSGSCRAVSVSTPVKLSGSTRSRSAETSVFFAALPGAGGEAGASSSVWPGGGAEGGRAADPGDEGGAATASPVRGSCSTCFASCASSHWRFRYFRITIPQASQKSPVGCTNVHLGHCMVPGAGPGGTSKVGSGSVSDSCWAVSVSTTVKRSGSARRLSPPAGVLDEAGRSGAEGGLGALVAALSSMGRI